MLDRCLDSLALSGVVKHDYSIHILNNFGTIEVPEKYCHLNVSVINNEGRPDFSGGHLARTWNQAIIHGFVSLKDPDCEIVVAVQHDVVFSKSWFKELLIHHEHYSFIQVGVGDDFQSFTPECIRKVGLYDERMCNIGGQHYEYYFRQIVFNNINL